MFHLIVWRHGAPRQIPPAENVQHGQHLGVSALAKHFQGLVLSFELFEFGAVVFAVQMLSKSLFSALVKAALPSLRRSDCTGSCSTRLFAAWPSIAALPLRRSDSSFSARLHVFLMLVHNTANLKFSLQKLCPVY
jgi:hypothetical protein